MRVYPEPNTGCWLWSGRTGRDGYGQLHPNKDNDLYSAHRYSYFIHKGDFDRSKNILHKCDVPCCVNPDHLYVGDQAQNVKDMIRRGRKNTPKGEKSGKATLTNETAIKIFKAAKSGHVFDKDIAKMFNTTRAVVAQIKHRRSWAHLTKDL